MSESNNNIPPKSIKKERENIVAKYFYRPISEPIAILLSNSSISPNQVTVFSVFLSVISGIFFAFGEWKYSILGAVFLQFAIVSDHVDGNLARFTGKLTPFGHWWDSMANKQIKFFVLLGMSYGAYGQTENPLILLIGSVAIFNITYASFIAQYKKEVPGAENKTLMPESEKSFFPISLILYAIITMGGLTNQLWFPLVFLATFGFVWIKQILNVFQGSKN